MLIQFVGLVKSGVRIKNSTRAGKFLPLSSLIADIGVDAARYFYLMRKNDQCFDIDINLAQEHGMSNPVFYLQYAHARAAGVFRKWHAEFSGGDIRGWESNLNAADIPGKLSPVFSADLGVLAKNDSAMHLCEVLNAYPAIIYNSAHSREVHHFVNYLQELASAMHAYYDKTRFLSNELKPGNLCSIGFIA